MIVQDSTAFAGLIGWFKPWSDLYGGSTVLSGIVTGVHIGALTFGGGLAISADRTTLRALRGSVDDRRRQLAELHSVHTPVLIGLTAMFVSGVLMATADLDTFLPSPVFWLKLTLVTCLLINGAILMRTETSLRAAGGDAKREAQLWDRLTLTSWMSLGLWATTLAAGVTLANI